MTATSRSDDHARCCRPTPLSPDERACVDRRLAAAQARAQERQPAGCPRCFDDGDITPTFDPDGAVWACGCGWIWTVER